jgi:hypothetical protein
MMLRSPPLKKTRDLTKMTTDELYRNLMAYEMRIGTESDQTNNEVAFEAIKKTKYKDNDLDEEIDKFRKKVPERKWKIQR